MADYSRAQDPQRMAQLELSAAYGCSAEDQPYHLARAQVFATLALVDAVRSLADQQVQVTVEDGEAFQLRGIAVRRGGAA